MTDEMDEIWALYADDGAQALDAMEEALDDLQSAPEEAGAQISALFRAVHTFKGNSRVLGLRNVEAVAHLAEDLIGLVRDEGVALTGEIVDILVLTGDVLRRMLEETADSRADVDPGPTEGLKSKLRSLYGRLSGKEVAEEPAPAPAPAAEEPEAEETPEEKPAKAKKAAPKKSEPVAAEPEPEPEPEPEEAAAPEAPPAPKPAAKPAFDANLAGLLDQLDGGGFSFDDIDAEELETSQVEEEPEVEEAPQAAPEPAASAPAPAPAPGKAHIIAEVTSGKVAKDVFAADPMYRDIFADMADKTRNSLEKALSEWSATDSPSKCKAFAGNLSYAAGQLGLTEWTMTLDGFAEGSITTDSVNAVLASLKELYQRDLGGGADEPAAGPDPSADPRTVGRDFFTAVAAHYPDIASIGMKLIAGEAVDSDQRRKILDEVNQLAERHGYVRLADASKKLSTVEVGKGYRAAELDFYEQLIAIERTFPADIFDADLMAPSRLLSAWCADHVFETLQTLREGLDKRAQTNAAPDAPWFHNFETLMRRVHFACSNFKIETASQLTMALIDLFARVRVDKKAPDVILLQMARGFVDTMELVFDALDQGDTPDTARIEQMFEEATNVCFVASGVVTAKTIENRLGLPPEFHRVLSPESVKSAHAALEDGLHFFVLRADLNDDDKLAEGFLEWITSGLVRMITNVTVFIGSETLFDFLVASSLDEDRMIERLAMLDPSGRRLTMAQSLKRREIATDEHGDDGDGMDLIPIGDAGDSLALLEAIGAISASHALVEHELNKLASVDLMQDILTSLRAAGVEQLDPRVRNVLRDCLEEHSNRLQEVSESGAQLSSELSHLQQESVAHRSRPAEVLLRPLKAFVSTRSRKSGTEATLTYVGGDVVLDQMLIEELRGLLKTLTSVRLANSPAPTRFHVSISAESDHISVELTDNCPNAASGPEIEKMTEALRRKKGDLRHVTLPAGGGVRIHLRVPQHMIVLDGMVVRVGEVRYVLPIDTIHRILQTDRLLPVTAAKNVRMLNMDGDGLVPIRTLSVSSTDSEDGGARLYVIVSSGDRRIAIPVDELLGQQLVLLRPLQGVLSSVRDMSGVAILSGGEVGMVVAVSALASAA